MEATNKRVASTIHFLPPTLQAPITKATTVSITGWNEEYPSAGGFVCDLSGNYTHTEVVDLLYDLKKFHWVDDGTRVIMLEMSMYSVRNVRLL